MKKGAPWKPRGGGGLFVLGRARGARSPDHREKAIKGIQERLSFFCCKEKYHLKKSHEKGLSKLRKSDACEHASLLDAAAIISEVRAERVGEISAPSRVGRVARGSPDKSRSQVHHEIARHIRRGTPSSYLVEAA